MTWSSIKSLHPHQLGTLAITRGVRPSIVAASRIAVYGVEDGAEVIPFASYVPGAHMVGVDTNGGRLAAVKEHVSALGLANVELHECVGPEVLPQLGPFDYILVRDGLSRGTPEERAVLVEACAEALDDQGLLLFGYPVLPGWQALAHFAAWIRDRLTRDTPLCEITPEQVRALVEPLRGGDPTEGEAPTGIESLAAVVVSMTDHDVRSQILDPNVEGLRLIDVVALCEGMGLSYVGEAQRNPGMARVIDHLARTLSEEGELLEEVESLVELDLPMARRFSLFSPQQHVEDPTELLEGALFATSMVPESGTVNLDDEATTFVDGAFDTKVDIDSRLMRAVIAVASSVWPQGVPVAVLLDNAASAVAETNPAWAVAIDEGALHDAKERMVHLAQIGLADLRTEPLPVAFELGEWPRVSDLVRYQLSLGHRVTTPLHSDLELPPVLRLLAGVADGSRSADDVDAAFKESLDREDVVLEVEGERPPDDLSNNLLRRSTIVQGLQTLCDLGLIADQLSKKPLGSETDD